MYNRTHRGIDIVGRDELKKRKTNNEINVIFNLEMNFFFISKTNAEQNGSTVKVVRGDGEGGGGELAAGKIARDRRNLFAAHCA